MHTMTSFFEVTVNYKMEITMNYKMEITMNYKMKNTMKYKMRKYFELQNILTNLKTAVIIRNSLKFKVNGGNQVECLRGAVK